MRKPLEPETKNSKNNFLQILKILAISFVIAGIFIIAFLSVFFPKKHAEVIQAEKLYIEVDDAKIEADKALRYSLSLYEKKEISGDELLIKLDKEIPAALRLRDQSSELKTAYEEVSKKHKIFGFRSTKIFLGHLGMPVVATALGIYLLLLFFKEEDLFFRKVTLSFSLAGLVTGLFFVIWVFYPSPDVPEWAYISLLLIFSIIGTLAAYLIGSYTYNISQINLVQKTQHLLHFITFDIKKKYIRKEDRKEFVSDYLGEIKKLSQK